MRNRDSHEGMPEILDAFQDGEQYFGVIAIELDGVSKKFRFGVSRKGYLTLKKVLQLRPFDKMPGLKHQYFLARSSYRIVTETRLSLPTFKLAFELSKTKTEEPLQLNRQRI